MKLKKNKQPFKPLSSQREFILISPSPFPNPRAISFFIQFCTFSLVYPIQTIVCSLVIVCVFQMESSLQYALRNFSILDYLNLARSKQATLSTYFNKVAQLAEPDAFLN
jgi:hypothetical protein